jgi:hypothetical protein
VTVPVAAQCSGEFGGALVGEEQARAVDLDDVGGAGAEAEGGAPDPVAALRIGCLAWIRLAGDPEVRQIALIDAPAVLGWQRWRELDEQGSLGWIRAALAYAAEAGSIERRHVDVFAHIVQAAINEVALMIARADHQPPRPARGRARSPTSWTGC